MVRPSISIVSWVNSKISEIRSVPGRDAAKVEELTRDPTFEREARELFPGNPYVLMNLEAMMESERILARNGVFLDDDPGDEL